MPLFSRRRSKSNAQDVKPDWTLPEPALEPSSLAASLGIQYEDRPGKVKAESPVVAFHRPSSSSAGPPRASVLRKSRSEHGHDDQTIASLYSRELMPPARSTPTASRRARPSPPTLNIMVVGRRSSGKTSWLKTLLSGLELAPGANKAEHAQRVEAFCRDEHTNATKTTSSLSIDILSDTQDRIALTLFDTVGLPDGSGVYELTAEHQVSALMRVIEDSFLDAFVQEQQVVRSTLRAQDTHIHAVIYFITPQTLRPPISDNLTPPSSPPRLRTVSRRSMSSPQVNTVATQDKPLTNGVVEQGWSLSAFDARTIKKLSTRANVIPVIARSDELTLAELEGVRATIKRDLLRERLLDVLEDRPVAPRTATSGTEDSSSGRTTPDEPAPIVLSRSPTTRTRRAQSLSRRRRTLIAALEDETEDVKADADALLALYALISPERPGKETTRTFRVRDSSMNVSEAHSGRRSTC